MIEDAIRFGLSLAAILALVWLAGRLGFRRSDPAAPDPPVQED